MANEWYIRRGSNVLGPSTSSQLKSDAAAGLVKRDDEVSQSPTGPWSVARKVKGLFAVQQSEASVRPQSPLRDTPQSALRSELPNRSSSIANPSQSVFTSTANPSTTDYTKKSISIPQWAVIAIPAIVTLILGYFIGQEHLKYQMLSTTADVATVIPEVKTSNLPSKSPSSSLGSNNTPAEPPPESPPQQTVGQTQTTNQSDITTEATTSNTATLSIEAAIVFKSGDVKPVARVKFYFLDKDLGAILLDAGLKATTGSSDSTEPTTRESLVQCYGFALIYNKSSAFPEYSTFYNAAEKVIAPHIVKETTTDFTGKASFANVAIKNYFLFGVHKTPKGVVIWNLKTELKPGANTITLDQNNADFAL